MGNINSLRDWGHAKDFVRMQWMMLQQEKPKDYVIATGVQYSVRDFIRWSAEELGIIVNFEGEGLNEVARVISVQGDMAPAISEGDIIMRIDSRYFRPSEVETLLGDPSLAKNDLGWKPEITVKEMCQEMVKEDYKSARRVSLLTEHGLELPLSKE